MDSSFLVEHYLLQLEARLFFHLLSSPTSFKGFSLQYCKIMNHTRLLQTKFK